MQMAQTPNNYLALDVGSKRIGVALASSVARMPHPLVTIDAQSDVRSQLQRIIADETIGHMVVGLPRGLNGQDTEQTVAVRTFVAELELLGLPVYVQDEALTSVKAKAELHERGGSYAKGDVDALAATYILEDFLANQATH